MRLPTLPVRGRRRDRSRGQALVEFAFVLPIFLLILMILLDFGRVIYAQYTITQDAREASRIGVVEDDAGSLAGSCAPGSPCKIAAIRSAAQAMSPGVELTPEDIRGDDGTAGGDSNCPFSVSPNDNFYPDGTTGGDRVVVNIQVEVPLITPFISNVVGGSFRVCAQSVGFVQ
jgi:hypothetical protein